MYFKKVTDSYYGMCGTKRLYLKIDKANGRFSCVEDSIASNHMKFRGWTRIEKEEYHAN